MKKENKYTKEEWSWILYDVGNSAFTMLACSLVSVWFKRLAVASGVSIADTTAYWSYVASITTIIVAIIGPICGTIADNKGYKKPIFAIALMSGVLFCAALGFIKSWFAFLVIFILAKASYQASLVFYDSMVTDVTTPERMDNISSQGFAWGYLGSCLPFSIALILYVLGESGTISQDIAKIGGFLVTAVWWFLVSLPLLFNFHQKYYVDVEKGAIAAAFKRLGNTLSRIAKENKKVFLFLLAFFFYIDGVNTIIDEAVMIGQFLGLDDIGLIAMLLATQVVAFAFSLIFARLSKKYRTIDLLSVCIIGYLAVAIYAVFLNNLWQFGIMAFTVGMFQGAIQALSRSYYGKIIPKDNAGEYFGLYDIMSKGAAFLGTLIVGLVTQLTNSINIAVGTLAIFFALGLILIRKADRC